MALHKGQYGDVFRTLHWDVLRTSYFNVVRTLVEDVGRKRPQDVGRGRPLALNRGPYGDVLRTSSSGKSSEGSIGKRTVNYDTKPNALAPEV